MVDSEAKTVLPAKYLTDADVINGDAFAKGIGLFIDPKDLEESKGKILIHHASIKVLSGFIQRADEWVGGKADAETRIPLTIPSELFEKLSSDEKKWLYRVAGQGVRPLVRGSDALFSGRAAGGASVPTACRTSFSG